VVVERERCIWCAAQLQSRLITSALMTLIDSFAFVIQPLSRYWASVPWFWHIRERYQGLRYLDCNH